MGILSASGFWDFRRWSGALLGIRNEVCRNVLGGYKAVRVDLGGVCKEACRELPKSVDGWLAGIMRSRMWQLLRSMALVERIVG